jgi:lipopolysaccharide biosynthesis glycosyltransferase
LNEEKFKIYIGWDSREDIAYRVARQSILDTTSLDVEIVPLKQTDLKKQKLYWRGKDKLSSTEFTFTRFLVPELNKFKGWALFIDCDFVAVDDVEKLFSLRDDRYAVMCAKHNYTPKEGIKMDGQAQAVYPRKNWSSMILFNCAHPSNKKLNKNLVNNSKVDGKYLHRFSWLSDDEIGEVSHEWNWLVNWYKEPEDGKPKFIHYTEGGPWFNNYYNCEYASEYYRVERKYLRSQISKLEESKRSIITPLSLDLPANDRILFDDIIKSFIDPGGEYYEKPVENTMQIIQNKFQTEKVHKVAAIYNDDLNYENKNYVYDEYLEAFTIGSGGKLSSWEEEQNTDIPLIIRGVGKSSKDAVQHCWNTGRTFYAIDTGYFGNGKSKSKGWHRITKNNLQNLGPIVNRPHDRLLRYKYKPFTNGKKILICPPSEKVMLLFNQPTPEEWVVKIIEELKKYTDRPIEVRLKPNRTDRISHNSLEDVLADNTYCLITYNSIAALEALMVGKPAIALGPNCAAIVCNTQLSDIENLHRPKEDEMMALMAHLSYCQFSRQEMMNGYAWEILNESS